MHFSTEKGILAHPPLWRWLSCLGVTGMCSLDVIGPHRVHTLDVIGPHRIHTLNVIGPHRVHMLGLGPSNVVGELIEH